VLWDISARRGWFSLPRWQLQESNLLLNAPRRVSLVFGPTDRLTKKVLTRFIWRPRFEYFHERLLESSHRDQEQQELEADIGAGENFRSEVAALIFELFRLLGIINGDGISPQVIVWFKNARKAMLRNNALLPAEQRLGKDEVGPHAAALSFLAQVDAVGAEGAPATLINLAGYYLFHIIENRRSLRVRNSQ
jgi:hypothetical protein